MYTYGIIKQVKDDKVIAEFTRKSPCENCHNAPNCLQENCSLQKTHRVELENQIGAKVGDRVKVYTPDSTLLWDCVTVFVLPVLFTVILCCIVFACRLPKLFYLPAFFFGVAIPFIIIKFTTERKKPKTKIVQIVNTTTKDNK